MSTRRGRARLPFGGTMRRGAASARMPPRSALRFRYAFVRRRELILELDTCDLKRRCQCQCRQLLPVPAAVHGQLRGVRRGCMLRATRPPETVSTGTMPWTCTRHVKPIAQRRATMRLTAVDQISLYTFW